MSAKQAINDKLQCSVASLHISRVVGLLIAKLRKVYISASLRVKKMLKSVNIWQSYKQDRDCLVHIARLANTLLKDVESADVRDV